MDRRAWLKDMREDKGFSQAGLAKVLGVTRISVQHWERGTRTPAPLQRAALAETLGSAVAALFAAEDHQKLEQVRATSTAATASDLVQRYFGGPKHAQDVA